MWAAPAMLAAWDQAGEKIDLTFDACLYDVIELVGRGADFDFFFEEFGVYFFDEVLDIGWGFPCAGCFEESDCLSLGMGRNFKVWASFHWSVVP